MGKQRDETPNINTAANKDIIQRLNFLYQASVYLQSLDVGQSRNVHGSAAHGVFKNTLEPDTRSGGHKRKKRRTKRRKTTSDLSRDYIHCMRQVAQKTTVKIDPSLKRSLCFPCNSALVPGVSVSVRVEESAGHMSHMQYTCLNCNTMRRIPWIAEEPVGSATGHVPDNSAQDTSDRAAGDASHRQDPAQKPTSRRLPLFARPDAGHLIFRGDDSFSLEEAGCVPFV